MFTPHCLRRPSIGCPPGHHSSGTVEVCSEQFFDSNYHPPIRRGNIGNFVFFAFHILAVYARLLSEIIVAVFTRLPAFSTSTKELSIPSAVHPPVFLTPKAGTLERRSYGAPVPFDDARNLGYPSMSSVSRVRVLVALVAAIDTRSSTLGGLAGAHVTVTQTFKRS